LEKVFYWRKKGWC